MSELLREAKTHVGITTLEQQQTEQLTFWNLKQLSIVLLLIMKTGTFCSWSDIEEIKNSIFLFLHCL